MLAHTLSVEDEEAVEVELRELQREAVSVCIQYQAISRIYTLSQLGEAPETSIQLPSVPITAPVGNSVAEIEGNKEAARDSQRIPISA
jgi:charged multivesicular body protein 6